MLFEVFIKKMMLSCLPLKVKILTFYAHVAKLNWITFTKLLKAIVHGGHYLRRSKLPTVNLSCVYAQIEMQSGL